MQSICKPIGSIQSMPKFSERNLYMHKTDMANIILPEALMDYQTVITDMLKPLTRLDAPCYITIHEKRVINETHRRGGVHVDFNWYEDLTAHGGPAPGHTAPRPAPSPGWSAPSGPGHRSPSFGGHGTHRSGHSVQGTHKRYNDVEVNGGMLLVSNYPACKIYNGVFDGDIGEGGCCKDVDLSGLVSDIMPANEVFFINALGIHESLPISGPIDRSLVRINFHPDYIFPL